MISLPMTVMPPDSKLELLPSLPTISLALLIAAARLDIIIDTDSCNFNMAYDEYCTLGAKARVNASVAAGHTSGVIGVGGKVASRTVARAAWENLLDLELLIPVHGGSMALMGAGGGAS